MKTYVELRPTRNRRFALSTTWAPVYSPAEVLQFPSTFGSLKSGVAKTVWAFEPESMINPGSRRGVGPENLGKDEAETGAPPKGELSPIPPQSVVANAIRVEFVIGPTATDPSMSVSFFARAIVGETTWDQMPVHANKVRAVIRPAAPRTSSM